MSSEELDLTTFVNNRFMYERETYEYMYVFGAWRKALERIKIARPEIPSEYFWSISHWGLPCPNNSLPAEHEAETSGGGPICLGDVAVHDGGETSRPLIPNRYPLPGRNGATSIHEPAAAREETIPVQAPVAEDAATNGDNQVSHSKEMLEFGGSNADRKV
ncbi:hypothetical protein PQX77_017490 [Marasmius sp. AFHP31]|nr:hypothetical protein PQX77_017490 [Marasmius sp. AFHP31]